MRRCSRPGLQAGKARHVIEQMMQRGNVAHQNAHEIVPRGLAQSAVRQRDGRIGDDAEIAAQIVRRLPP